MNYTTDQTVQMARHVIWSFEVRDPRAEQLVALLAARLNVTDREVVAAINHYAGLMHFSDRPATAQEVFMQQFKDVFGRFGK